MMNSPEFVLPFTALLGAYFIVGIITGCAMAKAAAWDDWESPEMMGFIGLLAWPCVLMLVTVGVIAFPLWLLFRKAAGADES